MIKTKAPESQLAQKMNLNPQISGSANATIGIFRFLLSAVISSITILFH